MIVECPSCRSRFRLGESLFQGAKGLRLRCRKCGEGIAVLNPAMSSVPPDVPSPDDEPEITSPARQVGTAGPDVPEILVPESTVSPPDEAPLGSPSEPEVSIPAPPVEEMPFEYKKPRQPLPVIVSARPFHKRPAVVASALLFLLIAGGAGYIGFTASGKEALERLVSNVQSNWRGGAATIPVYDIWNVTGNYETSETAGKLFVIRGIVTNAGRTTGGGIRIQAFLFNDKSQALVEKTVYAGNVIPEEGLRQQERTQIEAAMLSRFGDRNMNKDIPPGKSLPFMVVFFNPQDNIRSYRVIAHDVQ
jgi:predicted Zn finger-like uncharacterized protein